MQPIDGFFTMGDLILEMKAEHVVKTIRQCDTYLRMNTSDSPYSYIDTSSEKLTIYIGHSTTTSYELAEAIANILSIRPSLLEVGSISELKKTGNNKTKERTKNRDQETINESIEVGKNTVIPNKTFSLNVKKRFIFNWFFC